MRNLKFRGNEYATVADAINAPKTVWQAIALSLARRYHGDDNDAAVAECLTEWTILHHNGIVPQKPKGNI